MWPVVLIVFTQLPERWFPDSFKCFCFPSEAYNFHFFCTSLKKNYEVTVKETTFWLSRVVIAFREFYVLILLQLVGRIPQNHL